MNNSENENKDEVRVKRLTLANGNKIDIFHPLYHSNKDTHLIKNMVKHSAIIEPSEISDLTISNMSVQIHLKNGVRLYIPIDEKWVKSRMNDITNNKVINYEKTVGN